LSDQTDTRVVAFRAGGSSTTLTNNSELPITFSTVAVDTHGGYSGSTYTVKVPGKYKVYVQITTNAFAAAAVTNTLQARIRKNGLLVASGAANSTGTTSVVHANSVGDIVDCNAGDTIDGAFFHNMGATPTVDSATYATYMTIERLSGPAQIAASEKIAFGAYRASSTQTAAAGTPLEVVCNTARGDTHGSYSLSTGRFTAPRADWYTFSAATQLTMGATAPSTLSTYFLKNGTGSIYGNCTNESLASTKTYTFTNAARIYLLAGDYVSLWVSATAQAVTVQNTVSTNDVTYIYGGT
jgi:hypothetical protein